ncbi:OmpA-OmpF porin, OOP family [Lysobacter enzymogenes]|nr:OmpA-OmpF porin, OOP family [Lysobacter enzymogenes]
MANRYRVSLLIAGTVMAACACASDRVPESGRDGEDRIVFSDPADFIGVTFKAGRPRAGEAPTIEALQSPVDVKALESDLELLKTAPANIALGTAGFTDSAECSGDACRELSLRRAKFLANWLFSHGIPRSRLSGPKGFGAEQAIGDNTTEEGRARNRRAYISYE